MFPISSTPFDSKRLAPQARVPMVIEEKTFTVGRGAPCDFSLKWLCVVCKEVDLFGHLSILLSQSNLVRGACRNPGSTAHLPDDRPIDRQSCANCNYHSLMCSNIACEPDPRNRDSYAHVSASNADARRTRMARSGIGELGWPSSNTACACSKEFFSCACSVPMSFAQAS